MASMLEPRPEIRMTMRFMAGRSVEAGAPETIGA
jgi:hypothetical protein